MTRSTSPHTTAPARRGTRRAPTPSEPPDEPEAVVEPDLLAPDALDEDALDPDSLEEVAALEAAATDEVTTEEDADATEEDGGAGAPGVAADAGDDDAASDLDALLTGMLTPEPGPGVEDDDRDLSGPDIEYVPTARRNEFVCSACFLIWNRRRLADPERSLCRDCIDDVRPPARQAPAAA